MSFPLPELKCNGTDELRLMTIRSEGQFNTVVYEEHDLYRSVERRDVILMHPEDIERLDLLRALTVTVSGPAGSMSGIHVHPFPGNSSRQRGHVLSGSERPGKPRNRSSQ